MLIYSYNFIKISSAINKQQTEASRRDLRRILEHCLPEAERQNYDHLPQSASLPGGKKVFPKVVFQFLHKLFSDPPVTLPPRGGGYPRVRPTIPFDHEDLPRGSSVHNSPSWQNSRNKYIGMIDMYLFPFSIDTFWYLPRAW